MKLWKPLIPFRVTKGNTDGSIEKGELLWFSDNGMLNIAGKDGGFMTPDELTDEITDFEAEVDYGYVIVKTANSEMMVNRSAIHDPIPDPRL